MVEAAGAAGLAVKIGSEPGLGARTAAAWLLAAMALRTSLRKIAMSRGAEMPIFTTSPSIREMRISMESPMTIDSFTLRERTSMAGSGCAGDDGRRLRVFDKLVVGAVA